jgi:hypothetical protein
MTCWLVLAGICKYHNCKTHNSRRLGVLILPYSDHIGKSTDMNQQAFLPAF